MSLMEDSIVLPRDAIPVGKLRRVLIIKLRHHGDVLLSSPVFSVLKTQAPNAELDALVYADTQDMLSLHPAIAQLHTIDRQWKKLGLWRQAAAELALLRALRQRCYDLIIHLTEHWRGAWLCQSLRPRWSVAPVVRGRIGLWRKSFTHLQAVPQHALRHTVESNLDALRRLGIQPSSPDRRLTLVPGQQAEQEIARHLAQFGLARGAYIHVHPASRWQFKCWPAQSMAALIERLQRDGLPVVLTAAPGPEEARIVEAIQSRLSKPALSLSGVLSLKALAALSASARLFVGVDSAPMHMAAALGTPTVALFGPSGEKQWGPWQVASRVIVSDHPCRPCGLDGCGGGKISECLTTLSVDVVYRAVHGLLAETAV